MAAEYQKRKKQAEQLYERYGRPFENTHAGQYIAISPDGKTILDASLRDVLEKARASFGPGSFVFKVGQRAVWRWR